jgi:hypothetical protein
MKRKSYPKEFIGLNKTKFKRGLIKKVHYSTRTQWQDYIKEFQLETQKLMIITTI